MAAPTITSVSVAYPNSQTSAKPGDLVRIVVSAVDADNYTITGTVTVRDGSGGEATAPFSVVVADQLTYTATASAGTIAQDPARPNEFVLTVPA